MTDKLKLCPFCGGEDIYEISREDSIVDKIPQLFCNGCKMTFEVENDSPHMSDDKTFEYIKEKLHTTWNTRKPMDRIVERLEALAEEADNTRTTYLAKHDWLPVNLYKGRYNAFDEAIEIVKGGDKHDD